MIERAMVFTCSAIALSFLLAGEATAAVRDDLRDGAASSAVAAAGASRFAQTHNPQPESRPQGGTGAASAATAGKQGSSGGSGGGATGAVNSAVQNWGGVRGGKEMSGPSRPTMVPVQK